MDTDIKHNETSSLPATVSPSPVIHPASTLGKAMSTNSGSASASGVDVGSVVEQAVTSSSNAQPATAAAVGDIKTSSNGAASTQETDNPDAEASGKPSGAPEADEPQMQTLSTTTQDRSLPDGEAKPDGQVIKDLGEDSAKNDKLSDNIQEGYVLVAHPDGTAPQALNKDSAPPLEGLSEHITEGEDGQEVEHFDPNTPPARIQAYARLEFPFFNFYIQKLSVTIGRRPPVSRNGSIPPSAVAAAAGSSEKILSHESTSMQDAGEVLLDGVKAPLDEVKTSHGNSGGEVDGTIKVKEEEEEEEKDGVPSLSHSSMLASQRHPAVKVEDVSVQQKSDQWGAPVASTSGAGAPSASASSVAADNVHGSTVAATPTGDAVADRTSVEPGPSCVPEVPMTVDSAEASAGPPRQTKDAKTQVDVDLGPIKAVSRDHARLFFDNTINPRSGLTNGWSLEVRGRNGLVLDGKWRAKGEISRLKNESRIQIAERIFHFVLPNGVPYPTVPPSPVMDEYFDGHSQNYGYPLTPDGSGSPIVYGSDSDELRSDNDDEFGYGYDDDDMDADGPNGSPSIGSGPLLDENGNPIKRKRGRPKKQRTAEQLAALELERQKRLDPSIPRRPRGRPPKHKKDDSIGGEMELSIPSTPLPDIPVPPTPDIPVPQLPHIPTSNSTELPIQVFQPIMPIAERPPPPALPQIDSDEPRLSKKQQAELKRAEKQRLKDEKTAQREKEKAEREAAKQAAKEAKAREVAEKKRKEEERKKAAAEEAKRIQEEKARNAEREKAEKEKQKAAAAAAAAEAKAKSQAEAKAKADAEAKAKAEAAAKAKPSSVATPTEKPTPVGMAPGEAKPSVAGTASPQIQSGAIPAAVPQPSATPAGATSSAVAGPSNAPALTSGVQTSSIAVSTPTHVPMPVAAKKTAPPKPHAQHPPKPAPPQQRHVPQQAKPQQNNVPTPAPFVPTNQFQGRPDKPPYSYPALIAQAIYSTPNKQATLQHIHMWIPDKYPFFREQTNAQILAQAIKQNLAVNRAFVNIPLPTGIALWAIETEQAKFFDGNTFLPPPNAQQVPYYAAQQAQQPQQHQGSPMRAYHPQHQQQYQQHQPHMSPVPIQPYPQHPQQPQHHHPSTASPAPLAVSPTRYQNGSMVSASPAPLVAPQSAAAHMPARATPQPTPVPSASSSSSSSSSKIPILIARPPPTYVKPTPPISAAATDPSSMVDNEGYPPLVIHDAKMHLSPTVFSSLTAQQLSNLQTIDTKQALNILQAFVVNYFKTELKKRKKAEKAAAKAGTATPMSASPSPAPAHGTKRSAPDDTTNLEAVKVQKVS